jgi:hypothetical protein
MADFSAEVSADHVLNKIPRRYGYTNPHGMSTTQLYGPHMTTAYSASIFVFYVLCGLFNDVN